MCCLCQPYIGSTAWPSASPHIWPPPVLHGPVVYVDAQAVGTGTGADWVNAMPSLPHTLIKGFLYVVRG